MLSLWILLYLSHAFSLFLSPIKQSTDLAVIILQGYISYDNDSAGINHTEYNGLAYQIHASFSANVWVMIAETRLEVPLSLFGAHKRIISARNELIRSGFNSQGSIYIAGHSLGGVTVQDFVSKHPDFAQGVILLGSTLLRKYDISPDKIQIPVMSINGELDSQVHLFL